NNMHKCRWERLASEIPSHHQWHSKLHHLTRLHAPHTRQCNPARCSKSPFSNHKDQEQHKHAKSIKIRTGSLIHLWRYLCTDKHHHKTHAKTDGLTYDHA